jgi:hypothetical protein
MLLRFHRAKKLQVLRFVFYLVTCGLPFFAIFPSAFANGHMDHLSAENDGESLPGDLLLFPDFTSISRTDQEPRRKLGDNALIPELNVFYTADYQKFRFLGEWLLNTNTHNLERIQFGLHTGESSVWIGRFHNPIGYWNMQYHHGAFLQTSITRPGIMAFETSGGVIPNHLTGLMWEGIHQMGEAGIYYTLGAGAGPDLTTGLGAFNVLEPSGSHRPAASFRLGYQPVSYGIDELGASVAYTQIPIKRGDLNQSDQFVASLYANKQFDSVRFLSELMYVHNRFDLPLSGKRESEFINAYGQLEWDFQANWTLFSRVEGTFNGHYDPYLALFPKYVQDRFLGGMRYIPIHNMAFKLEVSQDHLRDDRFAQVMLQWSALFP